MKASLRTGFDLVIVLFPHTDTLLNRMNQLQQLCSKAALSANPDTTWQAD